MSPARRALICVSGASPALFHSLHRFHLLCRGESRLPPLGNKLLERAAVLDRHHLAKSGLVLIPMVEIVTSPRRLRMPHVIRNELMQPLGIKTGHVVHDIDPPMEIEI